MINKLTKKLNIKYSSLQILHNIVFGVVINYATIFLKFKGFSNTEIGILLSAGAVLSIIIQPALASFADKTDKLSLRQICMIIYGINLSLSFLMLFVGDIKIIVFAIYIPVYALQLTCNSLVNSLASEYLNKGFLINFGTARGLGAASFAVFSVAIGFLLGRYNANILLYLAIVLYIFSILSVYSFKLSSEELAHVPSPSVDETNLGHEEESTTALGFLKKYKNFTILLIGIILIFYSHNIINTYLINIFENVGGGEENVGIAFAIGAGLELPIMAGFILLLKKFKCSSMIKFSAVFYFVKSFATVLASSVSGVYFAQVIHILGFALYTPAIVYYINMVIPAKDSVKGQTMANVASIGISSVLASITGGVIQDTLGVTPMLIIATIVTAIGVLVVFAGTEDTGYIDK